jgi:hypothetical protein
MNERFGVNDLGSNLISFILAYAPKIYIISSAWDTLYSFFPSFPFLANGIITYFKILSNFRTS